jgi:hypothetical protein
MARSRWSNRLIVFAILALPIAAFFVLQAISAYTRAGSVAKVWFVSDATGRPLALALDGIGVGARLRLPDGTQVERGARTVWRLVAVDLRTGTRLSRETVPRELELFAATEEAFWFRNLADGGDPHPRHPRTLVRLPGQRPVPSQHLPAPPRPLVDRVRRAGEVVSAQALDPAKYPGAGFLLDARTGGPVEPGPGEDLLVVHPEGAASAAGRTAGDERLFVVRLGPDGQARWRTPLERQRAVLGATRVGNSLVVVTGGAARDFAFSLSLATGEMQWVHSF